MKDVETAYIKLQNIIKNEDLEDEIYNILDELDNTAYKAGYNDLKQIIEAFVHGEI